MSRLAIFMIAIFLFALPLVRAVCTLPNTASIANQPALDSSNTTASTGTGITINSGSVNVNDTRLLQITITWSSVENRTVSQISIGADPAACSGFIETATGTIVNGWTVTEDTNACVTTLFAQYKWPAALYDSTCATNFNDNNSNTTIYVVDFDVYVSFEDYVSIERAGSLYWTIQASQVIVPVVLTYPLTVSVSMNDLRVFSNDSISIDVTLTSQTIQNGSPYHVKFNSLISRSFAVAFNAISYSGSYAPSSTSVAADGADTFLNTITREQHWDISITPGSSLCQFDGDYTIDVIVYWTGQDEQGNSLPESDNPIPNNSTASFSFAIDSQNFCGTTVANTISAQMYSFIDAPDALTGHASHTPHTGFLQNDVVYFLAEVSSLNLPIASVVLTTLEAVQGITTKSLVALGTQAATGIDYQTNTFTNINNNETAWQLAVNSDVFQVGQDRSLTYTFNALLTVTYDSGVKKRMRLRQSSSSTSAKASTSITLNQDTSASASIAAPAMLALLSAFLGIYMLF